MHRQRTLPVTGALLALNERRADKYDTIAVIQFKGFGSADRWRCEGRRAQNREAQSKAYHEGDLLAKGRLRARSGIVGGQHRLASSFYPKGTGFSPKFLLCGTGIDPPTRCGSLALPPESKIVTDIHKQ